MDTQSGICAPCSRSPLEVAIAVHHRRLARRRCAHCHRGGGGCDCSCVDGCGFYWSRSASYGLACCPFGGPSPRPFVELWQYKNRSYNPSGYGRCVCNDDATTRSGYGNYTFLFCHPSPLCSRLSDVLCFLFCLFSPVSTLLSLLCFCPLSSFFSRVNFPLFSLASE